MARIRNPQSARQSCKLWWKSVKERTEYRAVSVRVCVRVRSDGALTARKVSGGVSRRIWVSQRGRDGETCGKLKGKFLSSAASSRWTLQVQLNWTSRKRLRWKLMSTLLCNEVLLFSFYFC